MQITITDIGERRIQAIKGVRALTGLGLKDTKTLIDSVDGNRGTFDGPIGPKTIMTSASMAAVRNSLDGFVNYTVRAYNSELTTQLAINAVEAFGGRDAAADGVRVLLATLDPTAEPYLSLSTTLEVL